MMSLEEEMVDGASFVENLIANFLDLVEMIFAMQEKVQIKISNEETERITSVGEMLDFFTGK